MTTDAEKDAALRSMERGMVEMLAMFRGIPEDRIKVALAAEMRDGKEGVMVGAFIDGEADAGAEALCIGMIQVAKGIAESLPKDALDALTKAAQVAT